MGHAIHKLRWLRRQPLALPAPNYNPDPDPYPNSGPNLNPNPNLITPTPTLTLTRRAAILGGTKMGCYDTTKQWLRQAG